jgi:hypothetical protein
LHEKSLKKKWEQFDPIFKQKSPGKIYERILQQFFIENSGNSIYFRLPISTHMREKIDKWKFE